MLKYCESDHHKVVTDELVRGLGRKSPKIVAACIGSLTDCLKAFGIEVVKVSSMLEAVVPLLGHRAELVRVAAKKLVVEAYRYLMNIPYFLKYLIGALARFFISK